MAASKRTWSLELRGIGSRARFARERIGLGQREAAEHLGVSSSSVNRLELGHRLLELDSLIRLARLYRVPVGWLLVEEGLGPIAGPPEPKLTSPVGDRRRRGQS